jgi:hypothetical protein
MSEIYIPEEILKAFFENIKAENQNKIVLQDIASFLMNYLILAEMYQQQLQSLLSHRKIIIKVLIIVWT